MSYNGSGTFNINSTGQPVVAGTVITASAFNALTTDLATGLTTAITKDGQTTTTARITFAQGITSSLVTDSSSVSTGSIITAGGAGIAKNLYVGVNANVAGTLGVTGVATFSAAPIYSSLTASSAVATDASKGLVSVTNTGTGNNVLATAPTIASLNLTTALTIASASGTVGQVLTSGGSGGAPTWSSPSTTSISNGTSNVTVNSSGGSITATTNGTAAVTIDTSQNVGIGTASPTAKLTIDKSADSASPSRTPADYSIRMTAAQSNTYNGGICVSEGTYVNSAITPIDTGSGGAQGWSFITGNNTAIAEAMRINSSGQLLINTSTVYNTSGLNVGFVGNVGSGISINTTTATNGATFQVFLSTGSLIGSITNNNNTGVLYNVTSDYRLKNNAVALTGAKDFVMALKPKAWDWYNDLGKGVGFLAHEFMEVAKYSGHGEKDAVDSDGKPIYQTIQASSTEVMANIVALMQEQQATITAQAETINALTARITALENA